MTKEEKIIWLKKATNEQLLNQHRTTITSIGKGTIRDQIENEEDLELVEEELLRRMNK